MLTRFKYFLRIDYSKKYIALALIIISSFSCRKFLEVDAPVASINEKNIYENDETAASVLTGIYTKISNVGSSSASLLSQGLLTGLSGDELILYDESGNANYTQYFQNSLSANTLGTFYDYWTSIYPVIFYVNSAIDGLNNSKALSKAVREQLLGEAKFLRAYCYFYLVNFYGDVPLVLSSDYNLNYSLSRTDRQRVWDQVKIDLNDAVKLLNNDYVDNTTQKKTLERVRPNKWVAKSLLSRVYLYNNEYASAEEQASEVINNSSLYQLTGLKDVFLKNSTEAIWQIPSVFSGVNTNDGRLFIIPETGFDADHPVYLSNRLLNSFEMRDKRRAEWVDSIILNSNAYYYAYKYKVGAVDQPITEYQMIFRLAEQYLIRAEARVNEGNLSGAMEDLNKIRNRAGLSSLSITDESLAIDTILHERQIELFTESAHRWLDLKRSNMIDKVMPAVTLEKGGSWNANWQYYPILTSELRVSPNISQNMGY